MLRRVDPAAETVTSVTPPTAEVPDLTALVAAVRAASYNPEGALHGDAHWRAVAYTGQHLARRTPGAVPTLAVLFGLFHDAMRWDDGTDPEHGSRAAELAERLHGQLYRLADEWRLKLSDALRWHSHVATVGDPAVGACWDADRLDLWRLGIEPNPQLLSTPAAREPDTIAWARGLHDEAPGWPEIWAEARGEAVP